MRLLKGIPAKINLIPFNPWPGTKYECSDWERIERFSEIVYRAGYASPVRTPRGRDILAACGQLKSETEKLRARARMMPNRASAPRASMRWGTGSSLEGLAFPEKKKTKLTVSFRGAPLVRARKSITTTCQERASCVTPRSASSAAMDPGLTFGAPG